jgi:hypothetical protein
MRHSTVLALLCTLHGATPQMMTGKLGDAMAIMNNPADAAYSAMFDGGNGSSVKGKVAAMSGPGGKGVMFDLSIMGLPMSGGPFSTS